MARALPWIALALLAIVLVAAPLGLARYPTYILTLWLVFSVAAMGVNLIVGYAGQETLAQAAFLGVGAYTTALMLKAGYPFVLAFFASGIASFLIGIALGFPALRVQKHYLAFVTLAFSVLAWLVIRNEQWLTGGIYGMSGIRRPLIGDLSLRPAANFYWFVLSITVALAAVQWWIVRSPWGRAFIALRENPARAESLGVDTRLYTLLAFAIGCAYGGFAGALYAPLVEFIDPAPFALKPSILFLLMVVVGGSGTLAGPFVGAAVAVLLPEWLRFAQGYYLIFYALLVILLMIFCPSGLVGLWQRGVAAARTKRASAARAAATAALDREAAR